MAIYAIGDIHGCYDLLQRLLQKVNFNFEQDILWFVGDLISRGDDSLKVFEFVQSLGKKAVVVLGNHEISLISAYYQISKAHPSIEPILNHTNSDKMIDWLKNQPLLHIENSFALTHAGISPHWNLEEALFYATEVENELKGENTKEFFQSIANLNVTQWSQELTKEQKYSYILSAFTRMRYLNPDGSMENYQKGGLSENPNLIPWFKFNSIKKINKKIIFGHWASLGLYLSPDVIALDTGCVWGNKMSIVKLNNMKITQIECKNLS